MTMNVGQKRHLAERMRNVAEIRTCPECKRSGALVTRESVDAWVCYCKWTAQGKCSWGGERIWHPSQPNPT